MALSTAMWDRKALLARQESRGWIFSSTVRPNCWMFSKVTSLPLMKASAFSARRGTGPATPKAMRTRSKVFLSGLSRALTEVPRVAMSMALRMAYLI